jgi:5-methyltetrahydropteroyltriglutamate--homocysteine methyltransferase
VIGGTDCGFATFADFVPVFPSIAYAKLGSLAEGAQLASRQLW